MARRDDLQSKRDPDGDDEALLRDARRLLPALPEQEPRPGFAQRVAARAAEQQGHSWLASFLSAPAFRWAASGAVLAGAAALFVVARTPGPVLARPPIDAMAMNELAAGPDLLLAQRLDLYEDMTVIQNQDALEDLDVVSVLHTLKPEGTP